MVTSSCCSSLPEPRAEGTAKLLAGHDVPSQVLRLPLDDASPNAVDAIRERKKDLAVNTPADFRREEVTCDSIIRHTAVDFPLITNRQVAERLTEALERLSMADIMTRPWRAYRWRRATSQALRALSLSTAACRDSADEPGPASPVQRFDKGVRRGMGSTLRQKTWRRGFATRDDDQGSLGGGTVGWPSAIQRLMPSRTL